MDLGHYQVLYPQRTPQVCPHHALVPDWIFYLILWALPSSSFPGCCLTSLCKSIFSALTRLWPWWIGPPLVPEVIVPLSCLTLMLHHLWHCPLGLAFAAFSGPGSLPSQVRSPRLMRAWAASRGVAIFQTKPLLGTKAPLRHPLVWPQCQLQTTII